MKQLLEYSPAWCELLDLIRSRQSAIALSPRHYGKWAVLEKYSREYASDPSTKCIAVSSRLPSSGGDINYALLWEAARSKSGAKNKVKVTSISTFLSAFKSLLIQDDAHFMVFVGGAGRGHEESHFRVVSTFQRLLGTGKLTIVATDDYSSYYFQKQNFLLSDLHSLTQVQIGPTTAHEIAEYLSDSYRTGIPSAEYVVKSSERIFDRTGGHTGLAQEVLRALERNSWPPMGKKWEKVVDDSFKASIVLENITRAIEEDSAGYSQTSLEYLVPTIPEQNSPRIHVLRQLGVLHRAQPPQLELCGGAITEIVRSMSHENNNKRSGRLGTIVTESGPRLFEDGPVKITDDDLVVVHISDLHVGENYRYRLTWPGGQINPNEQSAAELLRDDLQGLGILGRVDGMVLSGDFVWRGIPEEFRRASSVVKELIAAAGVDLSRTVLIPGNHDVEWNPGSLGSRSYGKAVSRESYDDFVKLLGKEPMGEVDEARILSRSRKFGIHIIGLDSNRAESSSAPGIGFVSRDAIISARKCVNAFKSDFPDIRTFRWVAVHHHVFPATSSSLAEAEGAKISTMANAPEILEHSSEWLAELVLHGHEHQPCITVARRWPVDVGELFAPIASIGAGSFAVKREYLGPFSRNQYYLIIRRPSGILIRSRCHGSSGIRFVAHSDLWLPR